MNGTKHTPGPWKAIEFCGEFYVTSADDEKLAALWSQSEQGMTDALLMASAPDLLAALTALLAMCERQVDFNDDGDGWTFERCRAAIGKAIGDTP
jgi:hypothetical protein